MPSTSSANKNGIAWANITRSLFYNGIWRSPSKAQSYLSGFEWSYSIRSQNLIIPLTVNEIRTWQDTTTCLSIYQQRNFLPILMSFNLFKLPFMKWNWDYLWFFQILWRKIIMRKLTKQAVTEFWYSCLFINYTCICIKSKLTITFFN